MIPDLYDINIKTRLFEVSEDNFESLALEIFSVQYENNEVYRQYCDAIHVKKEHVSCLRNIPFLPIQFCKAKQVMTGSFAPEIVFESSGTTGSFVSKHLIRDLSIYQESFLKSFRQFYGAITDYCIIGLLPSYLERKHASLVFMVNELIKQSGHPESDFYLNDQDKLYEVLCVQEKNKQRVLLIGVTYALLDFADKFTMQLKSTIIMETGGMKGRREELTRPEVHSLLKQQLGINEVHSEYGMTELLSQAYSKGNGVFISPPWMKIMLRVEDDPFDVFMPGKSEQVLATGAVNIIDLANLYSCSFIATDDMGKLSYDGSFEIIGRLNNNDARGCGLMII